MEPEFYYDFSPHPSYRFIVLDTYVAPLAFACVCCFGQVLTSACVVRCVLIGCRHDVSLVGRDAAHPHTQIARKLLRAHNTNTDLNDPTGLIGDKQRFVKYNGGRSISSGCCKSMNLTVFWCDVWKVWVRCNSHG